MFLQVSPTSRRKARSWDELRVLAAPQVVEHFVEDEEEALVRMHRLEGRHHLDERVLRVGDLVDRRELVLDASSREALRQLGADDVSERHRRRTDVEADHLEHSARRLELRREDCVPEALPQLPELGNSRNDGHQVSLASPVGADDEDALVAPRRVEPEVGQDDLDELLGHQVGDDVGLDVGSGRVERRRIADLLDLLERRRDLHYVAVLHAVKRSSL